MEEREWQGRGEGGGGEGGGGEGGRGEGGGGEGGSNMVEEREGVTGWRRGRECLHLRGICLLVVWR